MTAAAGPVGLEAGRPALVLADSGVEVTHADLAHRSDTAARFFAALGLRRGDHVALLLGNEERYLELAWGAQRSGLFYTPVNTHLTAEEAAYIVDDCGARVLVTSVQTADLAARVAAALPEVRTVMVGGRAPGVDRYEDLVAALPADGPDYASVEGYYMFYSSGTTGRPKGIAIELPGTPFGSGLPVDHLVRASFGFGEDTVYLCPAPLYHAAPLGWSMAAQRWGGTVVLPRRFDAEQTLALIEKHRVTHAQFVPTMFVRMLKLPPHVRASYDLSSLRVVVHAAAPCPVDVKRAMIDWLGPIVHEFYAGSEGVGLCAIDSPTWLTRPGSVGRPLVGEPHIVDDAGRELPPGEIGTIRFAGTRPFSYHNDTEATAAAYDERGWATLGDLGWLDEDGFLYLADRRTDLIIAGGVNIYPREIEDVLITHPAVLDVGVVGLPDTEMGQRVHAVVQPLSPDAPDGLIDALMVFCRDRLAPFKCPRSLELVADLPRLPSGKLLRRRLRDRQITPDNEKETAVWR